MTSAQGPLADFREELLDGCLTFLARAWRTLAAALAWLRDHNVAQRLARLLATAALVIALLAGVRAVPVIYGRFALAHEARIAAQQSLLLGEDQVLRNLQRTAFRLGFPEAALTAGAFSLSYRQEEGQTHCQVAFDFRHQVNCFGLTKLPVRIHGKAIRPALERASPEETP